MLENTCKVLNLIYLYIWLNNNPALGYRFEEISFSKVAVIGEVEEFEVFKEE
jgi:hypothetical protein